MFQNSTQYSLVRSKSLKIDYEWIFDTVAANSSTYRESLVYVLFYIPGPLNHFPSKNQAHYFFFRNIPSTLNMFIGWPMRVKHIFFYYYWTNSQRWPQQTHLSFAYLAPKKQASFPELKNTSQTLLSHMKESTSYTTKPTRFYSET